jgi:hypothetical protein
MSRTFRRDNRRGTQRNEPYKKRVKNENLENYRGYSSDDFEEEDEFEWFDDFRDEDE